MKNTLLFLLFIVLPNSVCACKCIHFSIKENFNSATNVFIGDVINTKGIDSIAQFGNQIIHASNIMTIKAKKIFKGQPLDTIQVYTGSSEACGYPLSQNKTYLIYADFIQNKYEINRCTGTIELNLAKKDLKKINKIKQKLANKKKLENKQE